jgi:hypothetical protein|tara:strand:+ start:4617 stop:4868 length:252 start_codon:yes stop_codon:yes gene_type:complete
MARESIHKRAAQLLNDGMVEQTRPDTFVVRSLTTDQAYRVLVWDKDTFRCNCPVGTYRRQMECHHVMAVKMLQSQAETGIRLW